jgi:hypothetical protein
MDRSRWWRIGDAANRAQPRDIVNIVRFLLAHTEFGSQQTDTQGMLHWLSGAQVSGQGDRSDEVGETQWSRRRDCRHMNLVCRRRALTRALCQAVPRLGWWPQQTHYSPWAGLGYLGSVQCCSCRDGGAAEPASADVVPGSGRPEADCAPGSGDTLAEELSVG